MMPVLINYMKNTNKWRCLFLSIVIYGALGGVLSSCSQKKDKIIINQQLSDGNNVNIYMAYNYDGVILGMGVSNTNKAKDGVKYYKLQYESYPEFPPTSLKLLYS